MGKSLSSDSARAGSQKQQKAASTPDARERIPAPAEWLGPMSEIVKLCARNKVPIIPFGTGTGLEGNVVALLGGVCIDMSRMNRILQVSAGDLDATVEAGVTHEQLNEHLRDNHIPVVMKSSWKLEKASQSARKMS